MNQRSSTTPSDGVLAGKVALITGGTTGIGRATAELFRSEGASVIVTGQQSSSIERARVELGDGVRVLRANVLDAQDTRTLAETVKSEYEGLDVLFLNAGIAKIAPFDQLDEERFSEEMDVNVKGLVLTLKALLPLLRADASVIVNTSVASLRGAAGMSIYSATKGALSALVRSLSVELAPRRIRVNALAPGCIATPIQGKFGLPDELARATYETFCNKIPLGRFGEAREVASAALFLAGAGASFVTGAEIPVDGGLGIAV
jgi:NAD(P)-dependent dehydrogenase (short-subunit alcohol dehydrogenase family)